jgi:hypothetical protein
MTMQRLLALIETPLMPERGRRRPSRARPVPGRPDSKALVSSKSSEPVRRAQRHRRWLMPGELTN